jgi:hypothetical protein
MSWSNQQHVPEEEVIQSVISGAVMPTIDDQCHRMQFDGLKVKVVVMMYEEAAWSRVLDRGDGPGGEKLTGELRIRFRRTSVSGRSLYFAQLRLSMPLRDTGYSGFSMRGTVKQADRLTWTMDSVAAEYNMNEWRRP